jgi:MSHA biogenesis protein MshG
VAAFAWKGRDGSGAAVSGTSEGASQADVAEELFGRGITPLEIKPGRASTAAFKLNIGNPFEEKVQHADILLFSRQLYSLLKAGVPIMRALAGLQESSSSKPMRAVLQDLRDSLDSGRELSAALGKHPKVFPPFYLSMVRVGEMTGQLEEVFLRLFHHMEFERFMREQVSSALRYPSFVVAAMGMAIVVVNIWVIPAFAKVFDNMKTELPLMTRMLIGFSDFMVTWWPFLLVGAVGAAFAFRSWVATTRGRYLWDRFKLKIPIAGKIVTKATLARFSRSFALATRSGVPIIQALSNVAQTMDNAFMTERLEKMRSSVERGESMLRAAIGTGIFTPVVLQMIAVGEESGSLDEMMQEIAEMYQREVEYELKTLSQQIEPILIVFLGALVLVLAMGIFVPMWDMGKVSVGKQ